MRKDAPLREREKFPFKTVTSGTKGGRPRYTQAIQARAAETYDVIKEALVYMKQHRYLVAGGKDGLKTARSKYHTLAAKVGLIGKFSPHSLRYAYAVEKITELRDQGYNRQEAFLRRSMPSVL